jgi:rhodanese-related sulfurtransferase
MTEAAPPEIQVEELAERRRAGEAMTIVDVREDWEREIASLPGTINIPLAGLPGETGKLPHEGPLIVICRSGARSGRAVTWLHENGFTNAVNLAGGVLAWAARIDPSMRTY